MNKYLITLALLGGFSQVASANLIVNGSFEDYAIPSNSTYQVASDCSGLTNCITSTSSDPWQPISGAPNAFLEVRDGNLSTEVLDTPYGNVYAEVNFESFNGSGFQQTFSAQVGTGDLSWYDHVRGDIDINDYKVILNDNVVFDSSSVADVYDPLAWNLRSVMGVSLLDTNVLKFVHDIPNNHVVYNIDNVVLTQVSAVPEPESYAMFLAGLGLLGFASRKKAQK